MNAIRLLPVQVRFVNKAFWRNPASAFFTFAFPLMFLLIFTALLGDGTVHLGTRDVHESSYYVAAMAAYGVISACYSNLAITITVQRETGILKRTDGTPLPAAVFLGARVLHAVAVAILLVIITAAFGHLAYGADIPTGVTLLRCLVSLLVAAASFSALGFAVTALIPNADAAPAVVNGSILPLLFLSGIFIPMGNSTPGWIVWVARIFPIHHFAASLQAGFLNTRFHWTDVLNVAAWGLAALLIATRRFSWEPHT